MSRGYEIVGTIEHIETIAIGSGIRDIIRIREQYGPGRWRKMKGVARVRFANGSLGVAELHWYEAQGVGRRKMKIKRILS